MLRSLAQASQGIAFRRLVLRATSSSVMLVFYFSKKKMGRSGDGKRNILLSHFPDLQPQARKWHRPFAYLAWSLSQTTIQNGGRNETAEKMIADE